MKEKEKLAGEMTLEAAIVVPIVMALVLIVICFVLYVRDGLVLKACVYGTANVEACDSYDVFKEKVLLAVKKEQLYVLEPGIKFRKGLDSYKVDIQGTLKVKIWGMNQLIDACFQPKSITVEKNMSSEILWVAREIIKQVERK
ncbi:MAG: hypothetical protein K6G85_02340 [Eubacterium sp.]|nr:hypothetical protein [Eubacterium sp.]